MEVKPPNLNDKEVIVMNDYQIIDLIIRITGLVVSAVMLGIAMNKNNRH